MEGRGQSEEDVVCFIFSFTDDGNNHFISAQKMWRLFSEY